MTRFCSNMQAIHCGHRVMLAFIAFVSFSLVACGSNPPAPVISRLPAKASAPATNTSQKTSQNARSAYKPGDWRPDTYTVKAGDTLFSIGLAFGYDYKDIARANNIAAPYLIKVGQTLQLASLKGNDEAPSAIQNNSNEGVTTYALGEPTTTVVAQPSQANILAITEPKAIREPYSDIAFNTPLPTAKPLTISPTVAPTSNNDSTASSIALNPPSTIGVKDSAWAWPTKGKILSLFNQASNKGIDIAGTRGQAIMAASAGKVIYSGSDLRGYGKLVIIKHNATFLSVYAHNSVILVKEGQQVTRGQKIAEMGDTDSPNVKLHFEIRKQGQSIDPVPYLGND